MCVGECPMYIHANFQDTTLYNKEEAELFDQPLYFLSGYSFNSILVQNVLKSNTRHSVLGIYGNVINGRSHNRSVKIDFEKFLEFGKCFGLAIQKSTFIQKTQFLCPMLQATW